MAEFDVVLDVCVLVPASLCDLLLRIAAADLYHPHWSDDILAEVERTLVRQDMSTAAGAARRIAAMRRTFPGAAVPVSAYRHFIDAMHNDPGDRHVLAAAVAAGAHVIVTSNLRHFPDQTLAPLGVEAHSPDAFLSSILAMEPEIVVQTVREQSATSRTHRLPSTPCWRTSRSTHLSSSRPFGGSALRSHSEHSSSES